MTERLNKMVLHLIPSCHADFAWGHTRRWHERRYAQVIKDVLDIMEKRSDFRWYLETYGEELRPFMERHPDLMAAFRRRVQEGRIDICGVFSNPIFNEIGGETLVRNIILGRKCFSDILGDKPLEVYAAIDLFPGYMQIPQILRLGGFKYLRFSRPSFTRVGDFIWKGMDGSTIMCSRGTYDGSPLTFANSKVYKTYKTAWPAAKKEFLDFIKKDSRHPTAVIWHPLDGDDRRPLKDLDGRTDLDLFGFVDRWHECEEVPLRFSTPSIFFNELAGRAERLRIISRELDWSGVTTRFGLYGNNNLNVFWLRIEDKIVLLEGLVCLRFLWTSEISSLHLDTNDMWHKLLTTTGHASNFSFSRDYNILLKKLQGLDKRCEVETERQISGITTVCGKVCGVPVTVFNPLSWDRADVATVRIPLSGVLPKNLLVLDADGNSVPCQAQKARKNNAEAEATVSFCARVPGFGFSVYYISDGELTKNPATMASARRDVSAEVREGTLYSLKADCRTRELLGRRGASVRYYEVDPAVLCWADETNGPLLDEVCYAGKGEDHLSGPVFDRYTARGYFGTHTVRHEIYKYHQTGRIDFRTRINSSGGDGCFVFEVCPSFKGTMKAQVPFGVEKRTGGFALLGPEENSRFCPDRFFADRWIDYSDVRGGLCLIGARGYGGYAFDRGKNRFQHFFLKNRDMKSRLATIPWFFKLSCLQSGRGTHNFEYALVPHAGGWNTAQLHRRVLEFHFPLLVYADRDVKALGDQVICKLEPENIFISAMRLLQPGIVEIRLYEMQGLESKVELFLKFKLSEVVEVDFQGVKLTGRSIKEKRGTLMFSMAAWEIVTLNLYLCSK